MKKFITFLILFMFVFSFQVSFANEGENVVYLETYEEYQELLNSISNMDENKQGFISTIIQNIIYNSGVPVYKAKVTYASESETTYGVENSGLYYMQRYQGINVEVLEGYYGGKSFENCVYPLLVDSYGNIDVKPVDVGDVVYVSIYDDGETTQAYIMYPDSALNRWGSVLLLGIITIVFLLMYTGKYGAKNLIVVALAADLLFVVFSYFVVNYMSVWLSVALMILLVTIAAFALNLGVNAKFFNALTSFFAIIVVMVIAMYGFDAIAKIAGISLEAASLAENVYPSVNGEDIVPSMDFHALSLGITVIIMAFAIIPMIIKTLERLEPKSGITEDDMKKYLAEKILVVTGVLMASMLQKFMVIYITSNSLEQVINSEVLCIEFSRIMFVVIAMSLSKIITEAVAKIFE